MVPATVDVLSSEECLRLLGSVRVGRVGLSIQALPVVLPVNFSLLDDDVVIRTVGGTKFHAAAKGAVLAFEADSYEPAGAAGWSVLVQGVARVVTDPSELRQVAGLTLESWALDGSADRYIRITPSRLSGRRFQLTIR